MEVTTARSARTDEGLINGGTHQLSNIYAYHTSIANIIPLDLEYLRSILAQDFAKLELFWNIISYRMLTINFQNLPQFRILTQDSLKKFCRLCDLKLYRPGARIRVSEGGVVLHGSLQLLHGES